MAGTESIPFMDRYCTLRACYKGQRGQRKSYDTGLDFTFGVIISYERLLHFCNKTIMNYIIIF